MKNNSPVLLAALFAAGTFAPAACAADNFQDAPRLLLAHYMPCFPPLRGVDPADSFGYQPEFDAMEPWADKGNRMAKALYVPVTTGPDAIEKGYESEIRIAKAAGVDGFLVDELADTPGYLQNWMQLFKAAEKVGGFYIGLTPDEACLGGPSAQPRPGSSPAVSMYDQVYHWLKVMQNSPALLRYHGGAVLAPYGVDYYGGPGSEGGGNATAKGSAQAEHGLQLYLASKGIKVAYLPDHSLDSNIYTHPYGRDPSTGFQTFCVGQASFSPSAPRWMRDRALAYWPPSQMIMGEIAFVYYNKGWAYSASRLSSEYRDEWMWNIEHRDRVHWVQIITWNDLGETAIEPTNNHFMSFLALTRFYSDWFKTGKMPAIRKDKLFVFHRGNPYDAVPTLFKYKVKGRKPADEVEALAFLTAPATLVIHSGSAVQRQDVAAGIQSFIIPFQLGVQTAQIERDGKVVQEISTPIPIHDKPIRENLWFVGADSGNPPRPLPLDSWKDVTGQWTGQGTTRNGTGASLSGDAMTWEDYSVNATFTPAIQPAGLIARSLPKGRYEFTVIRDPAGVKWTISRRDGNATTVLDSNTTSVTGGAPMQLRFDCVGEHLIGYINGQLVSSNVYDYKYPLGQAGVIATGDPVAFSDLSAKSYDPVMPGAPGTAMAGTP